MKNSITHITRTIFLCYCLPFLVGYPLIFLVCGIIALTLNMLLGFDLTSFLLAGIWLFFLVGLIQTWQERRTFKNIYKTPPMSTTTFYICFLLQFISFILVSLVFSRSVWFKVSVIQNIPSYWMNSGSHKYVAPSLSLFIKFIKFCFWLS